MRDESSPRGLRAAADAVDAFEEVRLHRSVRARLFGDGGPTLVGGRYELGGRIGAGGMGVVYRARDRELDRDVAIKLVRQDGAGSAATLATRRFMAEARSLARLAHPNVVAIFDVGTQPSDATGGPPQVYLAMELCPGQDLRRWVAAASRPWRAVLDVLLAAGRGLVAAHEVGVIHRDVKPHNILVDDDRRGAHAFGRVRLVDFGVSRLSEAGRSRISSGAVARHGVAAGTDSTEPSPEIAGTPSYMPPEQHAGGRADERSDQYAFCVTAFELLYGTRPFAGATIDELLANARAFAIAAPPRRSRVPVAIHRALARGLQPRPEDRWPTLVDLLEALERAAHGRRRTIAVGGVLAAAAVLALALRPAPPELCTGAKDRLAGVWDDDRRLAVRDAVLATGLPYAAATSERLESRLAAYADAWTMQHLDACMATSVRADESATTLDARMQCLHRARRGLDAVVGVLANADAATVQRAMDLVATLPPVERCSDADALRVDVPVPDDAAAAAEVDRIGESIAHAAALRKAGRMGDAASVLVPELARARALAFAPVEAEVLLELGQDHARTDELALAEAELREAKTLAIDAGVPDVAARACSELVFLVGYERARPEEALALRDEVLALARGRPSAAILSASAHTNLGSALQIAGRHGEAEAEHRRAVALYAEAAGPQSIEVAMATNNLANALEARGEYVEAEAGHRRALAMRALVLGPEHPDVAMSRNNLANAIARQGRFAEAEAELRMALTIRLRAFGPDSADVATTRVNLGNVLGSLGRRDEERSEHRAALHGFERALGPDHPRTAGARYALAYASLDAGLLADAELELRAVLERHAADLGADHPVVSAARVALADVSLQRGDLETAEAEYRGELERREHRLGPRHPGLLQPVLGLARVMAARGDVAHARTYFDRAIAMADATTMPPATRAEVRFAAARALPRAERSRALWLAEQARDDYTVAGEASAAQLHDVEVWLANRRAE